MAEHLFIRLLTPSTNRISWIVTDAAGRRIGLEKQGNLEDVAARAGQHKVVLMVPGTEVIHTEAQVPLRGGSKLRQAIPFALEDQLAADVEDLHFAIGSRQDDNRYPVAVTARENMRRWLGMLESAGIRAHSIVADAGCVPETPGGVTVLVENDLSLVHTADGADLVFEAMPVEEILDLVGVHSGDEDSANMPVNLYIAREDHEKQAERLEFLGNQLPGLTTRIMVDGSLAHLAAGMLGRDSINLRQAEFAPRSSPEKMWKPWRMVAILAGLSLLVLVVGEAVQLGVLKNREAALQEQITATFAELFPNATPSGDPLRQFQSELTRLRAAAGNTDAFFLEALNALAAATRGANSGQLDSISFRNGVLDLKIIVPNVEVLDRIRQSMESAGNFEVELESANPTGNQVEGRIQLRRASV